MFFWVSPRHKIVVCKPQSDAGEIPKGTCTIFKTRRKFEIKLLHVSAQSSSSGSVLIELAKVIVVKIIS